MECAGSEKNVRTVSCCAHRNCARATRPSSAHPQSFCCASTADGTSASALVVDVRAHDLEVATRPASAYSESFGAGTDKGVQTMSFLLDCVLVGQDFALVRLDNMELVFEDSGDG